jgi:hypothetical protein
VMDTSDCVCAVRGLNFILQITLTLAPVDIEDDYTYQQVVWQVSTSFSYSSHSNKQAEVQH